MRKIDTRDYRRATRGTAREVNRQIVLNLIREYQPISRADLARRMAVRRGSLTTVVGDLVARGAIGESSSDEPRGLPGRRPTLLTVRGTRRAVVVDLRPDQTCVALADFDGRVLARDRFATPPTPLAWIDTTVAAVGRVAPTVSDCEGVAVVVPGIVDHRVGRIAAAPRLGWHEVDVAAPLAARLGASVQLVGAPVAGALAHLWRARAGDETGRSFAYVGVSDDVSVALVVDGAPLQGDTHPGAAFGHLALDLTGPACACGRRGCWEAFACNAATVARYARRAAGTRHGGGPLDGALDGAPSRGIDEVLRRARAGDPHAIDAVAESGYCVGRGLATVITAFGPGRIYVGGEITGLWDVVEPRVRAAVVEHALTDVARATPVIPDVRAAESRVLGAVAAVVAPAFAAPRVA